MDFTHKFATGPMPIPKLIEDYFRPIKVRRSGTQSAALGQRYSNPPFSFHERDFLNKFKYLYIIGREYEIPREDRQKTVGVSNVEGYKKQATEMMNLVCWNDLLRFEKEFPGTLALVPGPCQICTQTHEGCNRPKNKPCRHMDMMRFSMEGIGIDAETLAKFEIGLLLRWPDTGKLPPKLSAVMGILSNEKIPMDRLKAFFPDAEKNFLNFKERDVRDPNVLSPEIKRQTSWLDNQTRQRKELEENEGKREEWVGYKDASMDSSDYVKNQPWKELYEDDGTEEVPTHGSQTPSLPSEHLKNAPKPNDKLPTELIGNQTREAGLPGEHLNAASHAVSDEAEEAEETKYKWLGFKRSVEEANEILYNRPIPKFNVTEEEVDEVSEEEELPKWKTNPALLPDEEEETPAEELPKWKTNPALLPDEEETEEAPGFTAPVEEAVEQAVPAQPALDIEALLSQVDAKTLAKLLEKKLESEKTEEQRRLEEKKQKEEKIRQELQARLDAIEAEKKKEAELQAEKERIEKEKQELIRLELEKQLEERERLRQIELEKQQQEKLQKALEEEKKKLEREMKLPDSSQVDNVLSTALSIAKTISGNEEPQASPEVEAQKKPVRHEYKWLNYKSELKEEEN